MNEVPFRQSIRIIWAIASKDIVDAFRNKTTISVLVSSLFVFIFYMYLPILEQEDIIRLYDGGGSSWLPALEHSQPSNITVYSSLEEMQSRLVRSGESALGLVLPVGFDQAVAFGSSPELQGYLLNWVSEKQASQLVAQTEAQIAGDRCACEHLSRAGIYARQLNRHRSQSCGREPAAGHDDRPGVGTQSHA